MHEQKTSSCRKHARNGDVSSIIYTLHVDCIALLLFMWGSSDEMRKPFQSKDVSHRVPK